jgi:hypothetical protein
MIVKDYLLGGCRYYEKNIKKYVSVDMIKGIVFLREFFDIYSNLMGANRVNIFCLHADDIRIK